MSDIVISIDLDHRLAVESAQSAVPARLQFMQGDTPRLVLRGLRENTALSALAGDPYVNASIPYATLSAGITLVDAKPLGGGVKLQIGGVATPVIDFDESKASLAAKLGAMANVQAAGGLTVIDGGASNIYRVIWTTPANALSITILPADNKLTPLSQVRINVDDSIPGKVNIKFMRAPVAFTDDFSLPVAPPIEITEVRAGSSVRNAVQRITIPAAAVGGFAFTVAGFDTQIVPIASATVALIASVLNEPFTTVSPSDVRFVVRSGVAGIFDVEFIGAFAKTSQALLPFEMFDQTALDTPAADFSLKSLALEDVLDGAASVPMIFEITAADYAGKETTLVHATCTVINDGIDTGTATFVNEVATKVETVYVYPGESDPAVIARQGQKFLLPADGTNFTFTHNFNVEEIDVTVIKKTSVSPDHFGQYDDDLYDWRTLNGNQVELTFASSVPSTGLGSVEVWITTLDATPIVNEHRHTTDKIDGVGADDGHTLTQIIAELRNALPDGWPNIPAAKISGVLASNQIDLAALATALQGEAKFRDALRALITDSEIVANLASALGNSAAFITTLASLMANADVLKAIVGALGTSPDFLTKLSQLLTAALQNGSTLPQGTVLMTIPDIEEIFPAPQPRASGDPRGPRFAPVPVPMFSSVGPLIITGDQLGDPASNSGRISRVTQPVFSPTANGRRQIFFPAGTDVCCDGRLYFAGVDQGDGNYFPIELDRELGLLDINELQLAAGTRFAASFTFFLSTLGGLVGRYAFQLQLGVGVIDPADPAGEAISDINWTATPIDTVLNLSGVITSHTFGYTLERASDGTLGQAQTTQYATVAATTIKPASPHFFLRAGLSKFDATNSADPHGAIALTMKSQKASIVKL